MYLYKITKSIFIIKKEITNVFTNYQRIFKNSDNKYFKLQNIYFWFRLRAKTKYNTNKLNFLKLSSTGSVWMFFKLNKKPRISNMVPLCKIYLLLKFELSRSTECA